MPRVEWIREGREGPRIHDGFTFRKTNKLRQAPLAYPFASPVSGSMMGLSGPKSLHSSQYWQIARSEALNATMPEDMN